MGRLLARLWLLIAGWPINAPSTMEQDEHSPAKCTHPSPSTFPLLHWHIGNGQWGLLALKDDTVHTACHLSLFFSLSFSVVCVSLSEQCCCLIQTMHRFIGLVIGRASSKTAKVAVERVCLHPKTGKASHSLTCCLSWGLSFFVCAHVHVLMNLCDVAHSSEKKLSDSWWERVDSCGRHCCHWGLPKNE